MTHTSGCPHVESLVVTALAMSGGDSSISSVSGGDSSISSVSPPPSVSLLKTHWLKIKWMVETNGFRWLACEL